MFERWVLLFDNAYSNRILQERCQANVSSLCYIAELFGELCPIESHSYIHVNIKLTNTSHIFFTFTTMSYLYGPLNAYSLIIF